MKTYICKAVVIAILPAVCWHQWTFFNLSHFVQYYHRKTIAEDIVSKSQSDPTNYHETENWDRRGYLNLPQKQNKNCLMKTGRVDKGHVDSLLRSPRYSKLMSTFNRPIIRKRSKCGPTIGRFFMIPKYKLIYFSRSRNLV